ncbi:MAG TPA: GNAT family N-acetyltransferase [Gaiellaceae bacterium]
MTSLGPAWPLETERLTLRPYVEDDFAEFAAIHADPAVARWLYNEPRVGAAARAHFELKLPLDRLAAEDAWMSCAVVVREGGALVGDLSLHWVSVEHRTAEVGFLFAPAHQGRGYATEAARAVVDWAFAAGFHRVIGRAEARNVASARVLAKLGMRLEAHFVENEWVKGEWQSELVYAVLDREWVRPGS